MRVSFVFVAFLIFLSSCTKKLENPLDPESSSYRPPSVEIVEGPREGETVSTNSVRFSWVGNTPNGNEFRYRLTGYKGNVAIVYVDWTGWSEQTSVRFDYLDDLEYVFEVETRYKGTENSFRVSRRFSVNWVNGPTVKFFRLRNEVFQGDWFTVGVWIEDIQNFKSGVFKITFDKNRVELVGVESGSFPSENRLGQVIVPDFSSGDKINEANSKGEFEVGTGVMLSGASFSTDPPYLSGSGEILKLTFRGKSTGQSSLNFSEVDLRDYSGNKVQVQQPVNGIVQVK